VNDDSYLMHHGVKGQKWGVRNAETSARYKREGSRSLAKKLKVTGAILGTIAATTAIGMVNPALITAGANAVGGAVGIIAPAVGKRAVKSLGNYAGTRAIMKASKELSKRVEDPKAKAVLKDLSKTPVTQYAVSKGKKKLKQLMEEK